MKEVSIGKYIDAGCPFAANSLVMFQGVHAATAGRVCDTGCGWFRNASCLSYKTITQTPHVAKLSPNAETVREEAARRGISINQVRRERNPT